MFSLIISIIAIALVAALALASIYYGGSAFQEGSADAEASTVVNQGQQVQAAFTMAEVAEFDFANATASDFMGRLIEAKMLKESPRVRTQTWAAVQSDFSTVATGTDAAAVTISVNSDEICDAVEERFNSTFTEASAHSSIGDNAFGCDASNVAYYKL